MRLPLKQMMGHPFNAFMGEHFLNLARLCNERVWRKMVAEAGVGPVTEKVGFWSSFFISAKLAATQQ